MKIKVRKQRKVCILDCSGQLTSGTGDLELRKALDAALSRGERRIVLNYSDLRYMDSAGVGETVACSSRALEQSGVVKILLAEQGVIPLLVTVTLENPRPAARYARPLCVEVQKRPAAGEFSR